MKVAYVVPRYGLEVVGGAELGARMLAERLVSQLGWEAEVLTTCALDTRTWADEYEPGTVDLNGVSVHRFRSEAGRDQGFERFSRRVLADPAVTVALVGARSASEISEAAPAADLRLTEEDLAEIDLVMREAAGTALELAV